MKCGSGRLENRRSMRHAAFLMQSMRTTIRSRIEFEQPLQLGLVIRRLNRASQRPRLTWLQELQPAAVHILWPPFNAGVRRLDGSHVGSAWPPMLPVHQPRIVARRVFNSYAETALAIHDARHDS